MLDLDDRTRAEPHQMLLRLLDPYSHWKSLRHAYPVERPLNIRQRSGKIYTIGIQDTGAEALHDPPERPSTINHRINRHAVADGNGGQIGFPEVGDGEPFLGVDQRKQRLRR